MNLSSSFFDTAIAGFGQNKGMTPDKINDLKILFKNFRKQEIEVSEKASFGLPVPVLVHKRNFNKILGKCLIPSFRRSDAEVL
jgi:hypothetical protein